ncbi:uncharacterized protein LOC110838655 isoform X2 [Zootermopsis nevadensis]|nr:uncharacterized protein LOC110838655 isoform X2 [Zootermopsis nevadensis]XP_021937742.1 uncharacterized protein LOC110838655 isoform X2 [Zootermopsis nevadensis]XP_021937743.1 uncharacterized protein LOC110838655 isoform X2 [Zootermopsis nevadensis]XP_021937744.1 uncharacterized protein LOC110838655 isoform X2 [Zootermopsis nevadensis]
MEAINQTTGDVDSATISLREQTRLDFYRTYDVMTGVRIAATLGGFFSLMVLLVVYKSKCKSKSLSDEHLSAAAAAVAVEDEEHHQQLAVRALCIGPRRSLGNMSAPALVIARGARRFSSIGGYSALEPPSRYYCQRGKSLSGSALKFHMRSDEVPSFATTDRTHNDAEGKEQDSVSASPCCYHQFLTVPSGPDVRRLSSITCSSSDTSYLERRGSAVEMGIPAPPPFPHRSRGKGRNDHQTTMAEEPWDFYYPIDIQVIQPTPEVSPCGSERTLYDHPMELVPSGLRPPSRGSIAESATSSVSVPTRLAPLASISSVGGSLTDYPDFDDLHSIGSDSVFLDEGKELDTEDEVEGFSTDSEDDGFNNYNDVRGQRRPWEKMEGAGSAVPLAQPASPFHRSLAPICHWGAECSNGFHSRRHLSTPECHHYHVCKNKSSRARISAEVVETASHSKRVDLLTSSRLCETQVPVSDISQRPQYPLPVKETSSTSSSDSLTLLSNSRANSQRLLVNRVSADKSSYRGAKSFESLTTTSIPSSSSNMPGLPSLPLLSRSSCEHLIRALNEKTSAPPIKNCSWSQETLF